MSEDRRRTRDAGEPESSAYLRRSRQVEVRRSAARLRRLLVVGAALAVLAALALGAVALVAQTYLSSSPRFAVSDSLWIGGAERVPREQIAQVFASDLGRSLYTVPLARRRNELEAIPWVQSAHLMRGWPNRLRVVIRERTAVAFARVAGPESAAGRLWLIDAEGVLMPLPRQVSFSLPVLTGVSESQSRQERRRRVERMLAVLADLDRETPHRSGEVSEIDLSDPQDAAVTVTPGGTAVLVHLGDANYLERYKLFLESIEGWREQGPVRSVDMRFEQQVVVRP
jgi:cell division protein FtsQ